MPVTIPREGKIRVGDWYAPRIPSVDFLIVGHLSVEVYGEMDRDTETGDSDQATTELWYAKVTGFEGNKTVPDKESLNARGYRKDAISIVVQWYHQAAEVHAHLTSLPKSDMVNHLIEALDKDLYLAGTSEDCISYGTISSTATHDHGYVIANLWQQGWWLGAMPANYVASGRRMPFGIGGHIPTHLRNA